MSKKKESAVMAETTTPAFDAEAEIAAIKLWMVLVEKDLDLLASSPQTLHINKKGE